jgi:hypothetical protein
MRGQAFKRWLIRCAFAASCSLGGIALACPWASADPPAGAAAQANPDLPAPNGPASPTFAPASESTAPADATPRAAIAFETPEQSDGYLTEGGAVIVTSGATSYPTVNHGPPPAKISIANPPPQPIAGQVPAHGYDPIPQQVGPADVGTVTLFPRSAPSPDRKAYVDLSAAPCFGRAHDYSWIIGKVEHSSISKEWRLRYASVDEPDKFGGRVILVENQHVGYLRDGMYVQVRGHLVNADPSGKGRAFYRIESFQMVENPNVVPATIPLPAAPTKTVPTPPAAAPSTPTSTPTLPVPLAPATVPMTTPAPAPLLPDVTPPPTNPR